MRRHSESVEAFELYLKGRHHWHQRTPASLQTSIDYFKEAIRVDPGYALAHAGLADAYSSLAFYGYLPLGDARAAAGVAARRALAVSPALAESHYAMALFALWLTVDWVEAEGPFRAALEIQPRFAPAHTHYAAYLAARHRFEEARAHTLEAVALDALSPAVHATGALCLFVSGQYDDALRFGQRALELHANFAVALYALGMTYCRTGQFERAIDAFARLLSASDRAPFFTAWGALAHALAGRHREARALAADIAARHPSEYVHPVTPVLIGIALDDPDRTAEALRAYIDLGSSGFQICHVAPFLDPWAHQARFRDLLRRLHLVPEA